MAPLQCATLYNADGFHTKDTRLNPIIVDDGLEQPSAADMGFEWYDTTVLNAPGGNQVPVDSIRSVYVRPGCTLQVFENEGFTGRSGEYSAPANGPAGMFELNETPNNMNTIGIKSPIEAGRMIFFG